MKKAILTVLGRDKVGIVYRISEKCKALDLNILDINQTIMDDFFTMVIMIDYSSAEDKFEVISEEFNKLGIEMGLQMKLQSEEHFNTIFTV